MTFEEITGKEIGKKIIIDSRLESVYEKGTVANAINLPFTLLLNPDKTYKKPDELRKVIESFGIKNPSQNQDLVLSC